MNKIRLKKKRRIRYVVEEHTPKLSFKKYKIYNKIKRLPKQQRVKFKYLAKKYVAESNFYYKQKIHKKIVSKINKFKTINKRKETFNRRREAGALVKQFGKLEKLSKVYKETSKPNKKLLKELREYGNIQIATAPNTNEKERLKYFWDQKFYRIKAYGKVGKKLKNSQVFPSYFVNGTDRINDFIGYLATIYPEEVEQMYKMGKSQQEIISELKERAILEGHLKPLKQGSEFGYIDEENNQVWSGE